MSRLVDLDFFCFETRCPPWLHRDWRTISDICRQVCHQIHAFLAVIMWACRVRATSLMHRIVLLSWATTHAALSSCGQLLNHESGFMWLVQFEAVKAFRKGQKVAGWEGLCLFNTVYIYIYISVYNQWRGLSWHRWNLASSSRSWGHRTVCPNADRTLQLWQAIFCLDHLDLLSFDFCKLLIAAFNILAISSLLYCPHLFAFL